MADKIRTHQDLKVYQLSFDSGMEIFRLTKKFPVEERFSLTDQIRRSSRSVSGNIAEAWRKRRYPKYFTAKLTDSEGEAADPPAGGWLDYALACKYIEEKTHQTIYDQYNYIISMIVTMVLHPEKWQF